MPPHKTHQAGLSVDFMVPVMDATGAPAQLPATAANMFGYGIEFDTSGGFAGLRIDYDAMAEHLYQLTIAAVHRGVGIERVISDPKLTTQLLNSPGGVRLRGRLPFMKQRPWIRHDEHYHVDFSILCGAGVAGR
ncbi:M74 family metallopeptidase [Duganella sp. PWIR1]